MYRSVEQEFQQELSASERLLWSGKPQTGIVFRGSDVFLAPFSIMWCGFAIYWEFSVVTSNAPFFFMLWGIPFVLVGLYMVFGRFYLDSMQRKKTFYGLTNERIIIISGLFGRKVKNLNLKTLSEVVLKEKSNRSGTISFGAGNPMYSMFGGTGWPGTGQHLPPSFEMIPNVKDVYNMVRNAQKEA
ncbi:MAG: PH domain-containing protein [Deltaproteobacteria bacterium]|nr:PH domain-containing protein [Deltaproteobacteria bacterium]